MSEIVIINQMELRIKEYNGQRVVTFKDIDEVHERPEGTARRNFNTNKKYFIEGEDFYKITPNEFRTAIGEMDARQSNNVILITESGYYMLVKSFTDELSWQVQRELTNSYFRVQQIQADYSALSPQLQFMIQMEQRQNALEQRVTLLEQNQNQIQRLSILTATDTLTARFIKECCTRRICSDNITSAKLYIAFEMWCCQQGAMYIPKKSEFVNQMLDFFHTSDRRCIKRKSHGQLYYVITLTPQAKEKLGFVL